MDQKFVKVADVAQTSLHKIDGLAAVQQAIEQMRKHEVSSLVIERRHEGDEFGLLEVSDIAAKVVGLNKSASRTSVYEIMTKPVLSLDGNMNVKYAIRLLARLGHTRALVMGSDGGLLGLVTLREMVLSYVETKDGA